MLAKTHKLIQNPTNTMAEKIILDESKTEFLDLNDNCLEHVFNFCDTQTIVSVSKVCKRINALVTTVHFPRQTKFKYSGRRDNDCSEEQFIEILNKIGRYLVDLEIRSTGNIGLYELVGRTVTDRLRKLTIEEYNESVYYQGAMQEIQPALQHLEELRIDFSDGFGVHFFHISDERSPCPNLRRFETRSIHLAPCIGHWPRLEEICLYDEYSSMEEFQEFIRNNPQLRKFDVRSQGFYIRLQDIAQHLINLEELNIYQRFYDLSPHSILELRRLTHLERLTLTCVGDGTLPRFEDILNNVSRLNGLIELNLRVEYNVGYDDYYEPSPRSIIGIALNLPHLQVFRISYCKIEDKTILEFIRLANDSREFHIRGCIDSNMLKNSMNEKFTSKTLEAIVGARKENRNRIDPLVLHIDYCDDEMLEMLQRPNISAYLKVNVCGDGS